MENHRVGCHYCFKTLDPFDKQAGLRTFASCPSCNALYHESCFNHLQAHCIRCKSTGSRAIQVKMPAPLYASNRLRQQQLPGPAIALSITIFFATVCLCLAACMCAASLSS